MASSDDASSPTDLNFGSNPSSEVNGSLPTPPDRRISNVVTKQSKKKRKTRSKINRSSLYTERKVLIKEVQHDKSGSTNNLTDSRSNERINARKRRYEAEDDQINRSSSDDPIIRQDALAVDTENRREKFTQRFMALCSVIPGLTKMDEASVYGDGFDYIKHLQDRMKALEDDIQKKPQSAIFTIKDHQFPAFPAADQCNSSPAERVSTAGSLPDISIRFSQERILVRILCENKRGAAVKAFGEIESFGLTIVSTSIVPFTEALLAMTFTLKVDEELELELSPAVEDHLVKRLHFALKQILL